MKSFVTITSLILCCFTLQAQPAYDYSTIQMENLNRGVICVRQGDSTIISWRLLKEDTPSTGFNVYANGKRLNKKALSNTTFLKVKAERKDVTYTVKTIDNGKEQGRKDGSFLLGSTATEPYISIPLDKPENNKTPDGREYRYSANDASVGDVDGDGEYEIILKWDPSNAHDNSHEGFTGNVFIDCYKISKTTKTNGLNRLWRINLGRNIRAGAHYTQFMVFDFDGDGKAEVVCKTADGTIDGCGNVIGDATADYRTNGKINLRIDGKITDNTRHSQGRILEGPEFLTVFSGETGKALKTVDYLPGRDIVSNWGDNYGNRCDRFLACVAYLDGKHPSVVMCRGYYTQTYLAAWDWDGKDLTLRWFFDSAKTDSVARAEHGRRILPYSGQGNHNLRVGDVDGDGCDEITFGSMAIDHDGKGLYTTGMGHGDAIHQYAFYPDSAQLQIWDVHENRRDGSELRDAKTGRIIFQIPSGDDVGRGMAADIDPTIRGLEMWSASQTGYYDASGKHYESHQFIPQNSAVWWDGDLLRELLDHNSVQKFNWTSKECNKIISFDGCTFNNGTKQNPCLSADILGDWREEVIVRTLDSNELRIYTTTAPTQYRFPCWMQDIPYRLSVATENVGYNQPPEPGIYFGHDMDINVKR